MIPRLQGGGRAIVVLTVVALCAPASAQPQESVEDDRVGLEGPEADPLAAPGEELELLPGETLAEEPPPRDVVARPYFLEDVRIEGNERTRTRVIRSYIPLPRGEAFDPSDPAVETIKWRLLSTGWFREVRLRLERGSRRGWVVLVVEVQERNTIVVQQLAFGVAQGLQSSRDLDTDLSPYVGLQVAETNLLGLGHRLTLSAVASRVQQGFRIAFADPRFLGSQGSLRAAGFFNNAREFFGVDPLVTIRCPDRLPECPPVVEAKNAVVLYRRGGLRLGTGHDLGASTRYTLDWQFETVNVLAMPDAASEPYGTGIRPIDFSIESGRSFVSLARLSLYYDRRDDPALPSRGAFVRMGGDAGTRLLGSDYDFVRLTGLGRYWVPMPWGEGHSIRFGAFLGVVFGDAPFFFKFHASDLSDLIPSRVLEMELDRRPPPNLLDTAVGVMRNEEIGARLDLEYGLPLYRGTGGFRALNAYFGVGVYALADFLDLQLAVPGYQGIGRVPFDVTFDVGLRADTDVGVFQFGFSNILGFLEL